MQCNIFPGITLELAFQRWLIASYLYYKLDYSMFSDWEYDSLAKELLENWSTFEHRHKHLVSKEDLDAGTAYAVQYPGLVKGAALNYLKQIKRK